MNRHSPKGWLGVKLLFSLTIDWAFGALKCVLENEFNQLYTNNINALADNSTSFCCINAIPIFICTKLVCDLLYSFFPSPW